MRSRNSSVTSIKTEIQNKKLGWEFNEKAPVVTLRGIPAILNDLNNISVVVLLYDEM